MNYQIIATEEHRRLPQQLTSSLRQRIIEIPNVSDEDKDNAFNSIIKKPYLLQKLANNTLNVKSAVICIRDWKSLIISRNIKDCQTAMKLETPTLGQLVFYCNAPYAVSVASVLINDVLSNLNLGMTMNDKQLITASQMICDDYGTLRISEIRFCFLQGIKGVYGKAYNRIDIAILMDWLSQYDIERSEILQSNQIALSEKNSSDMQKAMNETTKATFLDQAPPETKEAILRLSKALELKSSEKDKMHNATKLQAYASATGEDVKGIILKLEDKFKENGKFDSFDEFIDAFVCSKTFQQAVALKM